MRTLLALFKTREEGLAVVERLRAEGLTNVQTFERPAEAGSAVQAANDATEHGLGTGATVGALGGGLVGAVPIAVVGSLIGRGLDEQRAKEYERVVGEGGIAVAVEAPEIQPAAEAETILRAGGAVHVETGEHPKT
jgi:hypothetical protein